MTVTAPPRRPGVVTRRFGYTSAVLVNTVLLYAANRWPGWEAVPFLTGDTAQVMGLVNASILVTVAANVLYLVLDPSWLKALGSILTTSVGVLALLRIWEVFPFDFGGSSFDWALVTHVLLGVGIVGSGLGIVTGLVALVKSLTAGSS